MDLHAAEISKRLGDLHGAEKWESQRNATAHLIRLSHVKYTSAEQIMQMTNGVIDDIARRKSAPKAVKRELAELESLAFGEHAMRVTKGASGIRAINFTLPYLVGDVSCRMHAADALAGMAWNNDLRAHTDMKASGLIVSSLIKAAAHEGVNEQSSEKHKNIRRENFLQNAVTIVTAATRSDDLARLNLQPAFNELIDMIFPPYGGSSGIVGSLAYWVADSKATYGLVNAMADTKIDFGLSLVRSESLGEWYDQYDGLDYMLSDKEFRLKEALIRLKPPERCHPF